jgi:hypothetical protein
VAHADDRRSLGAANEKVEVFRKNPPIEAGAGQAISRRTLLKTANNFLLAFYFRLLYDCGNQ